MYTYSDLTAEVAALNGFAETGSIGTSLLGRELFYIRFGPHTDGQMIITGGIHARENGTCALVMRQAKRLVGKELPCGIWLIPMLNPDGAVLVEKGASGFPNAEWLRQVNGGDDFSLWKANARAVDLNVNFPARWGSGKGRLTPAPHGYIGAFPLSEPETRALCDFTLEIRPMFTVSYHELGREVYWQFGQPDLRDRPKAKFVADYLGYKLVDGDLGSAGGYKDWCTTEGISAVTIEVGDDDLAHPAFAEDISGDIERNLDFPIALAEYLTKGEK